MTCICWADVILSTAIALLLVLLTYAVVYSLRPKLRIGKGKPCLADGSIRIILKNEGRCAAVNVRIEVCAYCPVAKHTYHFELDHPDFLILPGKSSNDPEKTFKTLCLAESAVPYDHTYEELIDKVQKSELKLRVRVHSYHSFSGIGKAEERMFDRL